MNTQSYKTVSATPTTVNKEWVVIDATDLPLGRLASRVALILRGKNKPYFTPHIDCGDNVIVLNADKVKLTGRKMTDRVYVRHTGYPGGQRFSTPKEILAKKPTELVRMAVKGMLPKNRLGAKLINNLYLYQGSEHPHQAQKPKTFNQMKAVNALGRRKSAVARVYVVPGKGNITINGRELNEYFRDEALRYIVNQPFEVTGTVAQFDVKANLDGGGIKGQAEALRLGIARALCIMDAEAYRHTLKSAGFLTRDAREVERKKPGQPGARKRFQFSKR